MRATPASPLSRVLHHWRLAAAAVLLALVVTGPPGLRAAQEFNTRVLTSAGATYAALRTINAVLSTAKQTSVGVEFVGAVEGKPAMILDPLDETVARVSDAVFLLAGLSALLAVAFAPLGTVGLALATVGLAAQWGLRDALRPVQTPRLRGLERGFATVTRFGLVIGLVLPLSYAAGGWLGDLTTHDRLETAVAQLQGEEATLTRGLEALAETPVPENPDDPAPGLMTRVLNGMKSSVTGAWSDLSAHLPDMDQVEERGTAIFDASLEIVAIYTLRLVVFPLLTLLFLAGVIRSLMRG